MYKIRGKGTGVHTDVIIIQLSINYKRYSEKLGRCIQFINVWIVGRCLTDTGVFFVLRTIGISIF